MSNEAPDKKEKRNASQKPKAFYARHMFAGVAGYEEETILVETPAMKEMGPSMVGCPIYVYHQDVDYSKIEEADGIVTECFYNEADGWLWAKFMAISDDAHRKIADGWSVSNAYIPLESAEGGTFHNVPYDRQITKAEFTHLAIVPNPRYEKAQIFTPEQFKEYNSGLINKMNELKNSKEGAPKMLKIFKREESGIDQDTILEVDGKPVAIKEMINALKNAKKNEAEEEDKKKKDEEEKVNMDSILTVGDEKMSLAELCNRYTNMKKNSEDEDAKKKEEEDKEKENESDSEDEDDKKEKEEDEKKNQMDVLLNAHNNKNASTPRAIDTTMDKLARGTSRYGSQK